MTFVAAAVVGVAGHVHGPKFVLVVENEAFGI